MHETLSSVKNRTFKTLTTQQMQKFVDTQSNIKGSVSTNYTPMSLKTLSLLCIKQMNINCISNPIYLSMVKSD